MEYVFLHKDFKTSVEMPSIRKMRPSNLHYIVLVCTYGVQKKLKLCFGFFSLGLARRLSHNNVAVLNNATRIFQYISPPQKTIS